jgi:putative flavoprotein involved in K+ transport
MAERIETIVVGAGQAGLATSYFLTQHGREHVVLERGRLAETWRSQRWDGFYLNTPNFAQRLPGFHYTGDQPEAFAPLQEVIAYLEDYAGSFNSPVREEVDVGHVARREDGFVVESSAGVFEARNVVIAAGAYQRPTQGALTEAVPEDVFQLHTSDYRRPDQLPDGAVLVAGSGQSGCQIAEELLQAGRTVYISCGQCGWLPRRYRGRELVHWLIETGIVDDTPADLPSPAARLRCNPPVSGNDGGHDCNPRWLADRGAILLGRILGFDGSAVRIGDNLEEALAWGDEFAAEFRKDVDEHVADRGLDVPVEEVDSPGPVSSVSELDLRRDGVSTILWANGYRPDHSWVEGVERDAQGWPLHSDGAALVPGLYFVGLHWLRRRKSSLFLGVGDDAEHVVSQLVANR